MSVDPPSSENFDLEKQYEQLVGIEHYTTSTSSIGGDIKQDLADFIVREILPSGETLRTYEKTKPELNFESKREQFTQFTVIKKNMDTIAAAGIIQDYLKVQENQVSWAGIKDNYAITAQRFSVKGNYISSLKKFKHRNLEITDIRPADRPVLVGQLWGNNFTINIRNTVHPFTEIQPILEKWKEEIILYGFPNYFGLQRFGHHRPNSHIVAKFLLAEDYKAAAEEYLFRVYPKEFKDIAEFRQKLQKGPMNESIMENFPSGLNYERKIVRALVKNPEDYRTAMIQLPKSLLHLILSSYQSYIFNKAISLRKKHGFSISNPIKGDIISILLEPFGHPSFVSYRFGNWHDEFILKVF